MDMRETASAHGARDEAIRETRMIELVCSMDDMTAEALAYAMEVLLENGARDVYTTAIGMKKSRPGVLLTVTCPEALREDILHLMFRHTSTFGIREYQSTRYALTREIIQEQTPYGVIRKKTGEGYGVKKFKYEYADLARIAKEHHVSIREVLHMIGEKDGARRL